MCARAYGRDNERASQLLLLTHFIHCFLCCWSGSHCSPRWEEEALNLDHEGLLPPEKHAGQAR